MKVFRWLGIALVCSMFIEMHCFGESMPSGKPKVYASIDAFLVSNGADKWKSDAKDFANALVDIGYDSSQWQVSSTGGFGGRLGVLWAINRLNNTEIGTINTVEIGPSIGYYKGPSGDITVDGFSTLAGNGSLKSTIDTTFLRFLLEGKSNFYLKDKISCSIGGGIGFANGKITEEDKWNGSLAADTDNYSNSSTGFTWEISPAITFQFNSSILELGLRYAGFPRIKETDNISEFKWNPFGFFLGFIF
jgi:hypothetical protein